MDRFPQDFMFEMNKDEMLNWRCQSGTSNKDKMGLRYAPYCFTEQGVAMLSSVLNSKTAIEVNIQIIRIFTRIREVLLTHKDILIKVEQLEHKMHQQEQNTRRNEHQIQVIFKALKELLNPLKEPRKAVGYQIGHSKD